jgi:hypothetical protein
MALPSRYGSPTTTTKASHVNVAGTALGGALKGAGKGAAIGSVIPGAGTIVGGVIGGIAGGISGLIHGKKANREADLAAAEQNYEQLMAQRQMNRQRAVSDGLASFYGAQASNPAFLRASKLGDPILQPTIDPGTLYGTNTEDWEIPAAPSPKAAAWWENAAQGAGEGFEAYMNTKPAVPTSTYRSRGQSTAFVPGTFNYKTPPAYAPLTRQISIGGSAYTPATQRNYFG